MKCTYECESCGTKWDDPDEIKECGGCDKDICSCCSENESCEDCGYDILDARYPEGFYKFGESEGAHKVSDSEVIKFLEQLRKHAAREAEYPEHERAEFYLTGTGDTCVILLSYEDEYRFIVAKEYEELTIEPGEIDTFSFKEEA